MKTLLAFALLALPVFAQQDRPVRYFPNDPTGACQVISPLVNNWVGGRIWQCIGTGPGGTWHLISAGAYTGGPGVTVAGSVISADQSVMMSIADEQAGLAKLCRYVGSSNTMACALTPTLTAQGSGVCLTLNSSFTNTAAVTLKVDGLPAIAVLDRQGNPLLAGAITGNLPIGICSIGTAWVIQGDGGSSGGGSGANCTVTYGASINIDLSLTSSGVTCSLFTIALAGNPTVTFSNPSLQRAAASIVWVQTGGGAFTATLPGTALGFCSTSTVATGKSTIQYFHWDGTNYNGDGCTDINGPGSGVSWSYCRSVTGTTTNVCNPDPPVAALVIGKTCLVLNVVTPNVTTATVNVSGLGDIPILARDGAALAANAILGNLPISICYQGGSGFIIQGDGAGGGVAIGGAVTGGTAGAVPFIAAGPVLAQDPTHLKYDSTNFNVAVGPTATGVRIGTIAGSSTFPGLWMDDNGSPTTSNYTFLTDGSGNLLFNAPYGPMFLRVANSDKARLTSASFITYVPLQFGSAGTVASYGACNSGTLLYDAAVNDATSSTLGTTAVGGGTITIRMECIFNSSGSVYTWILH